MQFRELRAQVGYVKDKPFEGKLWLRFSMEQQCPHCFVWTAETTPEYRLKLDKGVPVEINRHEDTAQNFFARTRFCADCGINFQMPKRDRERLEIAFGEWVTIESIEVLVATLPPFVTFLESLQAAQEKREPTVMPWSEPVQLPLAVLGVTEPSQGESQLAASA